MGVNRDANTTVHNMDAFANESLIVSVLSHRDRRRRTGKDVRFLRSERMLYEGSGRSTCCHCQLTTWSVDDMFFALLLHMIIKQSQVWTVGEIQ